MMGRAPFAAAATGALFVGASGIIAQTLLLRELLALFAGNELYIGLIIAIWVAAEAAGALAAGRVGAIRRNPVASFNLLAISFLISLPLMTYLTRSSKAIAGLPLDQALSLPQVVALAGALLVLPALLHGAQFMAATALFAGLCADQSTAAGRAYASDTLGTIVGGLLVSFLLLPFVPPFQAAALLMLAGSGIAGYLRCYTAGGGKLLPIALGGGALLLLACGGQLEQGSLQSQWRGKELLTSRNSPYQNIAVIRNQDQRTLYTDGRPLYAFPDADIEAAELLVHLPLLAHPAPQRVLLLGGGSGGLLPEILRYGSIRQVDYLELDPAVLATVREYGDPATLAALRDTRVQVRFRDGRDFVRRSADRYDVILIATPLPQNLQENRYYSVEFFRQLAGRCDRHGLLALLAPGSTAYYGPEMRRLTESLLATMRAAVANTLVLPGERNLFLGAPELALGRLTAGELARRLAERGSNPRLITPEYLAWLFDPGQLAWFRGNIGDSGVVNSDVAPYLLARQIFQNTATFNPQLKPLLARLDRLTAGGLLAAVLLLTGAAALASRYRPGAAVAWLIAGSGAAAMVMELTLLLFFQLLHGAIIQTIGLLFAVFMAGLWCGSCLATRDAGPRTDRRRLALGEAGFVLLAGGLALLLARPGITATLAPAAAWLLLLPLLLCGFCTGLQFPPATRLVGDVAGRGTALIYAIDLAGGCLGGFAGSLILLPLLGLADTMLLLVGLKAGSFLVLQFSGIGGKITQ